ncbi:MAG: hypothetical protein M9921_15660 [Fimbriimonadaceae bacterium]|nr:hypothetical protein [Fimbriimonadaceae bacterium]
MKGLRMLAVILSCLTLVGAASAQFMSEKEKKAEQTKIAALERSYRSAKAASAKAPKDPNKRAGYVKATNAYAYAVMTAASIPPKDKYPRALKLYRESQKVAPTDKDSKKWVKTIEDIYRSMGRPIPPL